MFPLLGSAELSVKLSSVADPGSGAFLPPGSGSGINFLWIPDPRGTGMFFGEIFLRILVL
jgi:hypothetical protein